MVFKTGSPGLLTDSVWTSLLIRQGAWVFNVFQSVQDKDAAQGLISEAKALGYWTVSVFPDQLTCWVGAKPSFDENRSGATRLAAAINSLS